MIQSRVSSGARGATGRRRRADGRVHLHHAVGEGREALRARQREPFLGAAGAERIVLHQPRRLRRGELRLPDAAGRRGDGRACGARLELDARDSLDRRHEDRGLAQEVGAGGGVEGGSHSGSAAERAGQRRARRERARPEDRELPVGLRGELARERSQQRPLRLPPLEHEELPLLARLERLDAERHELVAAGKALGRGLGRLLARREQRVEPAEETLAARARGRVREPLGREERRDRQCARVAEREVGEARQPGLEAVDDVVAAGREGDREIRAHADRDAHPAAPRDRHGRPERDEVGVEPGREGSAPSGEVARSIRGRENGDAMTARAQLPCEPGDVLVHVVRLRPGEGGDEGDAKCHRCDRV